ncbi:MAG: hypothetical protein H7177_02720 [Rhizobacter sp.]|nr:hypothetical protein [Bacteriovorax sp.]
MKATIILKPLEYTLEAIGEKWYQGDKLKGTLKVKNNSAEKIEIPVLKVTLYEGQYKKVKAKDAKGWSVVSENILADKLALNPSEEKDYSFEFKLVENCSVTDKTGSLYLGFNDNNEKIPTGNVELNVFPKVVITQILTIIENFLRFKVKEIKSGKGVLEVKLTPPTSREMSSVDALTLNISEIEKNLNLKYNFNLRGLDLASATMAVEKKTKEVEQTFTSKQYLIYGDSINQDFIIESFQSVLNGVKTKTM